jgi:hypothetical protein
MNFLLSFAILIFLSLTITACNKGVDPKELRAKSQARGDIIERSGTLIKDEKDALVDAKNRLRTGGGLLGKKPANMLNVLGGSESIVGSMGLPINAILWESSLEVISFMPLASADPFGGVIISDWYIDENNKNERCKLNIFIKGSEFKADNIRVGSFCQILEQNGVWVDTKINEENNRNLENAILNRAKKIKLSQN